MQYLNLRLSTQSHFFIPALFSPLPTHPLNDLYFSFPCSKLRYYCILIFALCHTSSHLTTLYSSPILHVQISTHPAIEPPSRFILITLFSSPPTTPFKLHLNSGFRPIYSFKPTDP